MAYLTIKLKYYTGIVFMVIALFACKPAKQYLPVKSHEGRNTLGYQLLGGKVIGGMINAVDGIFQSEDGSVTMEYTYERRHATKGFTEELHKLKMTLAKDSLTEDYVLSDAIYTDYDTDYHMSNTESSAVSIEYEDPEKRIISGVFELTFISVDSVFINDTTYYVETSYYQTLSNGRFDIKY